jgi:hypothetical protein
MINTIVKSSYFLLLIGLLMACDAKDDKKLFELMDSNESGISFENTLTFDKDFNVYTYRNYYNGGGVAIGDIDNDGLQDVYMTANMSANKLFLNKGNFKFEDITAASGAAGSRAWSTGVTMVDINADGYLDIYVCNSGDIKGDNKQNELFINNGDLTFSEQASQYKLDDPGFSTHASFFDYDKDGDLDVYLLNNSYQAIGSFNLKKNERPVRDSLGGDKLLRNDGGIFTDVSIEAGIYGSVIGFGLGVTVGDVNNDGWEDIYISNDFFERDYLYINNQDGTFREDLTNQIRSLSAASMGADMADIDNDGYNDIFVTEMLPRSNERLKSVTTFDDWNRYNYTLENGYFHQYTRNAMQLNNGNGTFSEIGRLTQVESSDWSWGALIFDMDNDGNKDLFISNGIYKDLTDQDYLKYISNEEVIKSIVEESGVNYGKLIDIIPSNKISNLAFKNNGGLQFDEITDKWGLGTPSFSNGSAYADLDNDGDLDLIVNNINMPAFVYRNNTSELKSGNFVQFDLIGSGQNRFAIGTKIKVTQDEKTYFIEQQPTRGFQSSMSFIPHLGLPSNTSITVEVLWPNSSTSKVENVQPNQVLKLVQPAAIGNQGTTAFSKVNDSASYIFELQSPAITFNHEENNFVDFDRDRLMHQMLSSEGPKVSQKDINNDGKDDVVVGGAKGFPTKLFLSKPDGSYTSQDITMGANSEDAGSLWFDADGDGDQDLYMCSGGIEFSTSSEDLKDRLYINDGKGSFTISDQVLPTNGRFVSSSVVTGSDFDGDGDVDLFVGERLIPFQYGVSCSGFILQNDGKGTFENITERVAPFLNDIGMIRDAAFADLNGDGNQELVIVGEYMSPMILSYNSGKFSDVTPAGLQNMSGWWNTLEIKDLNGDKLPELVIGNHGLNSKFRATIEKPINLYVGDFDNNGYIDPILTSYAYDGVSYPIALRHDLIDQIKPIKKKFPDYKSYKNATIDVVLDENQRKAATVKTVNQMETLIFKNEGNLNFTPVKLPIQANLTPIYAICIADFDGDGDEDILMGGNLYKVKPEVGRYDASFGVYLQNNGDFRFTVPKNNSGFHVDGEIRDIIKVDNQVLVFRNNDSAVGFKIKQK